MQREDALKLAKDHLRSEKIEVGNLRYAEFKWGFCEENTWGFDPITGISLLPSPFGKWWFNYNCTYYLYQGWTIAFDPPGKEAEGRDWCIFVWVDETRIFIRHQLPKYRFPETTALHKKAAEELLGG